MPPGFYTGNFYSIPVHLMEDPSPKHSRKPTSHRSSQQLPTKSTQLTQPRDTTRKARSGIGSPATSCVSVCVGESESVGKVEDEREGDDGEEAGK